MFEYPSIMSGTGANFREFDAYVFAKVDGRNTRWEYTRKKGWHKAGTRDRRFDATDKEFGPAAALFEEIYAEPLARIARSQGWDRVTAFAEYWGPQSLGGVLVPGDAMTLSLFDVSIDDRTLLSPRDFVKIFVGNVPTADYLGRHRWTRGLVERVYNGDVPGLSFEGAVGKGVRGEMGKAKTRAWLDAVRTRYAPEQATRIIDS
jgi:hypothetical protein